MNRRLRTVLPVTGLAATLLAGCSALPGGGAPGSSTAPTSSTTPGVAPSPITTTQGPGATSSAAMSDDSEAATTGPSTSAADASGPPAPVTGRPAQVTISASGDLLLHPQLHDHARRFGGESYDFDPMLATVRPWVQRADVAICQFEGAVTDVPVDPRALRTNNFVYPKAFAETVRRTGWDGCSTMNNHAFDNGAYGVGKTRAIFEQVGLKDAGAPGFPADDPDGTRGITPAGVGDAALYTEGLEMPVAQLAYTYTVLNSQVEPNDIPPKEMPWLSEYTITGRTAEGIIEDARRARAAGAEIVVVSLHYGGQWQYELTDTQIEVSRALMESGQVDLIIGNHAHVVQPCTRIDGRTVLYGLGNLLSLQSAEVGAPAASNDGVLVEVAITRDEAGRLTQEVSYLPTYVDRPAGHIVRVAGPGTPAHQRTVAAMSAIPACGARLMSAQG